MTSSVPVVPIFRAPTIVGSVLEKDPEGDVYHTIVVSTTMLCEIRVTYKVVSKR